MTERWQEQPDRAIAIQALTDREAFGALYDRYAERVYRYCLRRTGSVADAEDLTSAIFLRALERLDGYQGGSFAAWLFAIARTTVIDRFRLARRDADPLDEETVDGAHGPEEHAVQREAAAEVRALLARLLPDQREVMELRLTGLTGAEIAQAMGRSVPAIKMLQLRAMKTLRSAFPSEPSETEPTG